MRKPRVQPTTLAKLLASPYGAGALSIIEAGCVLNLEAEEYEAASDLGAPPPVRQLERLVQVLRERVGEDRRLGDDIQLAASVMQILAIEHGYRLGLAVGLQMGKGGAR